MVKTASLKEELFIVLIPGKKVLKLAQRIQKVISKYYNIYEQDSFPQIHLTVDRVKNKDEKKVVKILDNFIKNSKEPINIKIDKFKCFFLSENNFLVLRVEETNSLMRFGNKIHNNLSQENLSTIKNYDSWKYHITLLSSLFSKNPISDEDFKKLCFIFDDIENQYISQADKLELWRPTLNPAEKCIKSYNLRGGNN